ncbi:MAG: pilus assembly protein TadG-related protein [Terracidiphilus sp.]|jgi:Flp pilus assembly protein TadG
MRILKDEGGQTTIFLSLFLGLLMIGFLAFAVDVGFMFQQRREAQAAADAAAVAAAEEMTASSSNTINSTTTQNAANAAATANGFNTGLATNPAVVTLSQSNTGIYSNSGGGSVPNSWVTASVSKPVSTFFFNAFSKGGLGTVTIGATGVAGVGSASPTCICLLATSGQGLNMSNNAKLQANSCGVESDSSASNAIGIVGSANVCGSGVSAVSTNWDTVSNINNGGSICSTATAIQGASPCNPVLTVPTLPSGITCYANPINGWVLPGYTANYTLPMQNVTETNGTLVNEVATNNSICYTSLNLSDASSVTFQSGYTYFIQGDFTTGGGAPVTGSGVTFVISGNIDIANGVTVNLTAPTVSGVPGTLFFDSGNTVTIEGGSNSNFSGVIYAPNANVTLDNGTGTTSNMDFVSQTLTMAGGATLDSFATPALSGAGSGVAKLAQ